MRRVQLFGLDFVSDVSIDALAELLVEQGATRRDSWKVVVTPNIDHLVNYRKFPQQRLVAETAHMVLPDGAPIVWASRLLGAPLSSRLAGSDLFVAWWQRVRDAHRPVLLVAATGELGRRLQLEHGEARIVVAPMFDASDPAAVCELANDLLDDVNRHATDAIVIGLSMAKTHVLAQELTASPLPADGAPLVLLLGASAEFQVGLQRRAPRWMQRIGFEWLHRLASDPRRLGKRYLVDDMVFIPMVWHEWRSRRKAARCGDSNLGD